MSGIRITILSLFAIVLLSSAQTVTYYNLISTYDGLSGSSINSILLDNKGYLWIGTNKGLDKYDGYHFNTLQIPSGLFFNRIQTIAIDKSNRIWFLANNEIYAYCLDLTSCGSKEFEKPDKLSSLINPNFIAIDKEDKLWIITDTSLIRYDHENKYMFSFSLSEIVTQSVQEKLHCIVPVNQGVIFGTSSKIIFFNYTTHQFKIVVPSSYKYKTLSILPENDTIIWAGTNVGLYRIDLVNQRFQKFSNRLDSRNLSKTNIISVLNFYSKDALLIGTQYGLFTFNKEDKKFQRLPNINLRQNYHTLPVTSILKDNSGIFWAGTKKGLIKITEKTKLFSEINNTTSDGFPSDIITAINYSNDRYFIGTMKSGLYIINPYGLTKLTSLFLNYSFEKPTINHISEMTNRQFLISTDNGLYIVNKNGYRINQFEHIFPFTTDSILNSRRINKTLVTESLIWIAFDGGILKINKDTQKENVFTTITIGDKLESIGNVIDFQISNDKIVWFSTYTNIYRLNQKNNVIRKFGDYYFDVNNINCLFLDKDDNLWIGTNLGFLRYFQTQNSFKLIEPMGIKNNYSVNNLWGWDDNIWFSTSRDIRMYIPIQNQLRIFDQSDGLPVCGFHPGSISSKESGEFILGGGHGIVECKSILYNPQERYPPIDITKTTVSHKDDLSQVVEQPDTIFVPYRHNFLRIEFTALDLSTPSKNKFKYKFSDKEQKGEWIDNATKNYVLIPRIKPGIYYFTVTGCNKEMVWNPQGAELVVIVSNPFWRKNFAIIIYIIIGSISLYFLFRIQTRALRKISKQYREREKIARQLLTQKEELAVKNKNITDSINYAQRIQTALLPSTKYFNNLFEDSFILHLPKDIVSGDFYWANRVDNRDFISVVDCTGHGVPGAFMSIIGFELFRSLTGDKKLIKPSEILDRLNTNFKNLFQDVDSISLRDGMDIAFCAIDREKNTLEYAGAFNPLYLIRQNSIIEVKGDRFSVGLDISDFGEQKFKNNVIELQNEDIIYIFSDGFADQFGGPEGKKYKYRRFRHLLLALHQLPMERQKEFLRKSIMEWKGELDQVDDILIIGVRFNFNK